MSLVLIITGFATRSFFKQYQLFKLYQASTQISALIKQARVSALTDQQGNTAYIQSGAKWCINRPIENQCSCATTTHCDAKGQTIAADQFPSVTVSTFPFIQTLTFNAFAGTSLGSATTIRLTSGSLENRIILSHLGRIRQCSVSTSLFMATC